VNFDDAGSCHLYYGDEFGSAGTTITFFPRENLGPSREVVGMATEIGYSVPKDSFNSWKENLQSHNIIVGEHRSVSDSVSSFLRILTDYQFR